MIKILKGSKFAVISHRFQKLIPILIWGFRIFSNSRRIMIRSKSTKWKAYSNNQMIAYFVLLHVSYLNFFEIFVYIVQKMKSIIAKKEEEVKNPIKKERERERE